MFFVSCFYFNAQTPEVNTASLENHSAPWTYSFCFNHSLANFSSQIFELRTIAKDNQGWGASLFRTHLKLISATSSPGTTTFSFTVGPEHCNRLGNLHGGCIATIFDICTTTSLAPIAKPGFWAYAGVTRTLNVTYIRPVPEGMKVVVESEVVHAGKRLCMLKGVMRKETGEVLASCEHGKVSIDPEVGSKA